MKKSIIVLCILFFVFCPIYSAVNGIAIISPYFNFDNSPTVQAVNGWFTNDPNWWETSQDRLLRFENRPSLLSLGIDMDTEHVDIVGIIEVREDLVNFMTETSYSNIPYLGNTIGAITNLNFPRVGYVDVTFGGFYGSIGRRQIKWGPATYDVAISNSAPYIDNIWLQYKTNTSYGNWWFSFIAAGFNNSALKSIANNYYDVINKNLFAHRIGFENSFIRVGVGELNLVYNTIPSILDFTPLGIWHNLYQDDHSNVMLHLSIEGKIGPVRAYGVFGMDDFDLPSESSANGKPAAMGFISGVEWHVLDGEAVDSEKFSYSDYILAEDTFRVPGGLNIGAELYYTTNFLYNRNPGDGGQSGKFTVPMRMFSFSGGYYDNANAFFIGFPYGPGSLLVRAYSDYESRKWTASCSLEWLRRGVYTIEFDDYTNPDLKKDWFFLKGPFTDVVMASISGGWYPQPAIKVSASLTGNFDITHSKTAFICTIGAEIDLAKAFLKKNMSKL